jgi:hypothetical protein
MNIEADCPTKEITIAGQTFVAPAPYAAEHVLTEMEAKVLNQTLIENLRNNFATRVKQGQSTEEAHAEIAAATQADFDAYVASYEFGVKRSGGRSSQPVDPVEKEARKIAREKVVAALKGKGVKVSDLDKDVVEGYITKALETYPVIKETAANVVAARTNMTLDLDV